LIAVREFMPGDIVDGVRACHKGAEVIEVRGGLLKTDKGIVWARNATLVRYQGQHEASGPFDALMKGLT